MRRIEDVIPPADTLDGQIQRRVRQRPEDDYEVVWSGARKDISLVGNIERRDRA